MTLLSDLKTPYLPNWCPGCGNMTIWAAFKNAAVVENWNNTNTVVIAGIGCHGHEINFTKINSFEGLHGRPIPVATGVKIANNRLNVFVSTGDGDCLGEGGNHFIHACRRNHDINILIHDNAIYGLTTGQTSPASPHGMKSKSTPGGNPDEPFNPAALAIVSGASFVARAYSSDIPQLTNLIIQANNHPGVSVIDILQPCVTFNKICTHQFYQQNTYYLDDKYNKTNKETAITKALEWGEKKIALGILYESDRPSYESQLNQIKDGSLSEKPLHKREMTGLFKKYS